MPNEEYLNQIRTAREEWETNAVAKVTAKFPERKAKLVHSSGVTRHRVYTPEDLASADFERDINFPGQYPFTRGVQPTMYRGRFWTMRQYAGFGTAEESNRRYKYLLEQGQTGLSVAFDLPTQIGLDSDNPLANGEVGKVGVAVCSLADMEVLFAGIPLDKVSTSMTINAPASVLLAMYLVMAEKQGVPWSKLSGTIQNDVLKEYIARGTYIFPPAPSMRLITDIFEFCSREVPRWNTISISGYHIREAGATAAQEIAFTLADGLAYVEATKQRGLDVDEFAPQLSFFFNAHIDFFEEVAKFRAARRLWARLMKERFNPKDPRSLMLRFHTQTAGSTLTAQQPDNNIIRTTLEALAAVLGGTQSLHTNSRDEALALPSEDSVRIALRTQQVIAYESGAADTIDPLAGSYYIERLTTELEEKATEYLNRIEQYGGAVRAIEQGYQQREIQESAYRFQQEIESKDRVVVGVNQFQISEEPPKGLLRVDPSVQDSQVKRIRELKGRRDQAKANESLDRLTVAAQGTENLMPFIIEAVRQYATLGEICDRLRAVFGEYEPVDTL